MTTPNDRDWFAFALYLAGFAGYIAFVVVLSSCAPVPEFDVQIIHSKVDREAVQVALDFHNDETEDCNPYHLSGGTRGSFRERFGIFPPQGTITIDFDPSKVHRRTSPNRIAVARESIRCGARGRVFLDNVTRDMAGAIAHEIGHNGACLDHEPRTFMALRIGYGLTITDEQRADLNKVCAR